MVRIGEVEVVKHQVESSVKQNMQKHVEVEDMDCRVVIDLIVLHMCLEVEVVEANYRFRQQLQVLVSSIPYLCSASSALVGLLRQLVSDNVKNIGNKLSIRDKRNGCGKKVKEERKLTSLPCC